jgi:hypothetical protein
MTNPLGAFFQWETIRKGVELQLSQASPVTRALFNASYFAREHNIPLLAQAGDAVVLSKVRAFTGVGPPLFSSLEVRPGPTMTDWLCLNVW